MATTTTKQSAFSLNLWAGILGILRWILVGMGADEVAQVHPEGTFCFVRFALVEGLFLLPGGMLLGIKTCGTWHIAGLVSPWAQVFTKYPLNDTPVPSWNLGGNLRKKVDDARARTNLNDTIP